MRQPVIPEGTSAPSASAPRRLSLRRRLAALALLLVAGAVVALATASPAGAAPSPSPAPAPSPQPTGTPTPSASATATPTSTPSPSASDSSSGSHGLLDEAFDGLATWIENAAASAAEDVLGALGNEVTSPNLSAPWFNSVYWGGAGTTSAAGQAGSAAPGAVVIAAWICLLVVTASLLVGVIRGDVSGMVRLVALRLPVAILLTSIAAWLVTQLLSLTDVASGWVLQGGIDSLKQWTDNLQSSAGGHDFLTVIACLILILASLLGYLELLARDAAIYIVVAFVPLIAVASLWSGAHSALKRAAETIFVLVISKFVLVFVLTIGAGALSSFATGSSSSSIAPLLIGTLIFLLAAFAPFAVFKLLPFLEMSAVAGLVGGASRAGRRWAGTAHDALGGGLGILRRATSPGGAQAGDPTVPPSGASAQADSAAPSGELRLAGASGGGEPGSDPDGPTAPSEGPGGGGPTPGAPSLGGDPTRPSLPLSTPGAAASSPSAADGEGTAASAHPSIRGPEPALAMVAPSSPAPAASEVGAPTGAYRLQESPVS